MAAFINALYEEGTLDDIKTFIHQQRAENGLAAAPSWFYDGWSRYDLIEHLSVLWSERPNARTA